MLSPRTTVKVKISSCWNSLTPWRFHENSLPYFGKRVRVKGSAMVKVYLLGPIAILVGMDA